MGSYAIIGAHLPMAAARRGRAQYRGTEQVAVCFFGDGTTNIGAFHEALNFAVVWKLPVVFVCENNLYMEYTPIQDVTAVEHPAADRAARVRPGAASSSTATTSTWSTAPRAKCMRARAQRRRPGLIEARPIATAATRAPTRASTGPKARSRSGCERDPLPLYRARLLELGFAEATLKDIEAETRCGKVERGDGDREASPPPSLDAHRQGRLGGRRLGMAELTYRDAVAAGIAQEMARDERVVFLGEDVAAAGGVFKATVGLLDKFGPKRVRDTPISEQAILGAAMGAAMTGLRPIAEIMFSDFFAVCWDIVANEIAKTRYMTNGQITLPLVIRSANGAGSRFGAQHSQSRRELGDGDSRPQGRRAGVPRRREGAARRGHARSRSRACSSSRSRCTP